MNKMIAAILGVFLILIPSFSIAQPPASFQQAKMQAAEIFKEHRQTLYCHCNYNAENAIDLNSCHLDDLGSKSRAHRLEWEHMMSAENIGKHFQCWREPVCSTNGKLYKGRRCCVKTNSIFKKAEAELYNLWPEVGLVNQARSNYRFSELPGESNFYGCNFKIDRVRHKAEPDDSVKGIVARAHLFMSDKYHLKLSKNQRLLFTAWNERFPPEAWERAWALRVEAIEGYPNTYITNRAG